MLRIVLIAVALFAATLKSAGQDEASSQPFKGSYFCEDTKISLELDLYEESIEAPNMSFLGKLHGYMSGRGVYGVWMVTDCEIDGTTATIRLSNDVGSDSQTIIFKQLSDSIFSYKATGGNSVRKAIGRKLVKVEENMTFKRVK